MNKSRAHYSEEEENIIKLYYPQGGTNLCKKYLSHRSKESIKVKAQKLKIYTNFTVENVWSFEEIEILKKYYPLGGKQLCKQYLPNRTLVAIWQTATARKLNLDYQYKNLKSWTAHEIEFLKKHYSTKGAAWCATKLNLEPKLVRTKANKLGLTIESNYRATPQGDFVYRDFSNIFDLTNPKIIYLLGFIWADGHIGKSVIISNISEDLDEIIDKLNLENLLPGVSIKQRQPQRKEWKPQTTITFGNKEILAFLIKNNYTKSRLNEPIILERIPKELRHYWFRGYLDGDGCVYVPKTHKTACLSFTGHYDSTYKFLEKLGESFQVTPRVNYRVAKNGSKFSRVIFDTLKRVLPILDYIYQDWAICNLGLNRKYEKYQLAKTFIK